MIFQTFFIKIRDFIPISRIPFYLNRISLCLFFGLLGVLGARIVENNFLTIPYQQVKFRPPQKISHDKSMAFREFHPILDQNVFNAEKSSQKVIEAAPITEVKMGATLSQIIDNLHLLGVSYNKSGRSFCIIRDKKKNQEDIFSTNDFIFDTNTVITRILLDGSMALVYLRYQNETGILKYLEEAPKPGSKPQQSARRSKIRRSKKAPASQSVTSEYTADGKNFYISSAEVDNQLNNFAKLLNQARMIPYFVNGKPEGFQVKAIDRGSLYEKLGLKNGDIIKELNGDELNSIDQVMGLFKKLKSEKDFAIKIVRKGSPLNFNYNIN